MFDMDENEAKKTETVNNTPAADAAAVKTVQKEETGSGINIPLIIGIVILILAGLIFLFIKLGPETTGNIRDISLIIYALGSIVTTAALVVLVVQAAKLVNFLKYEISPILNTTDKTVKKLSGTVSFLCENAVEPTVKAASTISGIIDTASGIFSIFKK